MKKLVAAKYTGKQVTLFGTALTYRHSFVGSMGVTHRFVDAANNVVDVEADEASRLKVE